MVTGADGSAGFWIVQIANLSGAEVVGIASPTILISFDH